MHRLVRDILTITFKCTKDIFESPVEEIHFGKAVGLNVLKYKDIAEAPHIHPIVTSLYANVSDIELSPVDFNKKGLYNFKQQRVIHNGFQFWISTYDNKELRTIHFHFIESELRQAVGKKRHNTESATVKLFNDPLPEACVNDEEIKADRQKLARNKYLSMVKSIITKITKIF